MVYRRKVPKNDIISHIRVDIVAEKPNYEVGSSAKLSFAKPAAAAWKLDDGDDEDLIDADDLLDEEDKVKPDPSELRGIEICTSCLLGVECTGTF